MKRLILFLLILIFIGCEVQTTPKPPSAKLPKTSKQREERYTIFGGGSICAPPGWSAQRFPNNYFVTCFTKSTSPKLCARFYVRRISPDENSGFRFAGVRITSFLDLYDAASNFFGEEINAFSKTVQIGDRECEAYEATYTKKGIEVTTLLCFWLGENALYVFRIIAPAEAYPDIYEDILKSLKTFRPG